MWRCCRQHTPGCSAADANELCLERGCFQRNLNYALGVVVDLPQQSFTSFPTQAHMVDPVTLISYMRQLTGGKDSVTCHTLESSDCNLDWRPPSIRTCSGKMGPRTNGRWKTQNLPCWLLPIPTNSGGEIEHLSVTTNTFIYYLYWFRYHRTVDGMRLNTELSFWEGGGCLSSGWGSQWRPSA